MNTKIIEKEFDERFESYESLDGSSHVTSASVEELKSFLISKVKEAREETIKEVLKMLPKEKVQIKRKVLGKDFSQFNNGYNQAITDTKNKIDTKL